MFLWEVMWLCLSTGPTAPSGSAHLPRSLPGSPLSSREDCAFLGCDTPGSRLMRFSSVIRHMMRISSTFYFLPIPSFSFSPPSPLFPFLLAFVGTAQVSSETLNSVSGTMLVAVWPWTGAVFPAVSGRRHQLSLSFPDRESMPWRGFLLTGLHAACRPWAWDFKASSWTLEPVKGILCLCPTSLSL